MVTGSNTIGDPDTEGQLDTSTTLTFISGQVGNGASQALPIPSGINVGAGSVLLSEYSLQSIGGPGSGGKVRVIFSTNGDIIATSGLNTTGDVTESGTGYVNGQTVKILIPQKGSNQDISLFFTITSANILANPNSITTNGFILSGSVTTGDIPETRNSSLILGESLSFTGGTGGTQNVGTITNVPTLNYMISTGVRTRIAQGSGLTVDITSDGTNVSTVSVNQGGSGYRPGDQVIISQAAINSRNVQGGTTNPVFAGASGIAVSAFIESDFEGSSSPFSLNFNPSPISSSLVTSSLVGATTPIQQQLLVGGPQLAVFHSFNTTVSSSFFDINSTPTDLNKGPTTALWTTSGSNPSNTENYYNWAPESSDCNSYTNTNTAFLIEKGDIIRVEGTLNTITPFNVSQSTNIIQDFTVEGLQNYTYTSSFSNDYNFPYLKTTTLTSPGEFTVDSQGGVSTDSSYTNIAYPAWTQTGNGRGAVMTIVSNGGNFDEIQFTSIGNGYKVGDTFTFAAGAIYSSGGGSPSYSFSLVANSFDSTALGIQNTIGFQADDSGENTGTLVKGSISSIPTIYQGLNRTFTCTINSAFPATPNSNMELINSSTGSENTNVGGVVTAQIVCGTTAGGNSGPKEWAFTGGENIPEGTRFSIPVANIKDNTTGWGAASTATTFEFVMYNGTIIQQPTSNNFTFGVDVGGTAESGSETGFHNYEKGEVGFIAPTFVQVSPNPLETLIGLPGGEVTKMTIRRQIESDDKVMLKNVTPPSGSRGIETISGQGFLIPNDFSPQQKLNALNIINQLKGINAFNKPNEPGITATNLPTINLGNENNNSGNTGGRGSGGNGGGSGGIQ